MMRVCTIHSLRRLHMKLLKMLVDKKLIHSQMDFRDISKPILHWRIEARLPSLHNGDLSNIQSCHLD